MKITTLLLGTNIYPISATAVWKKAADLVRNFLQIASIYRGSSRISTPQLMQLCMPWELP